MKTSGTSGSDAANARNAGVVRRGLNRLDGADLRSDPIVDLFLDPGDGICGDTPVPREGALTFEAPDRWSGRDLCELGRPRTEGA